MSKNNYSKLNNKNESEVDIMTVLDNIVLWSKWFPYMGKYMPNNMEDYYEGLQEEYMDSLCSSEEGYGDEDYLDDYENGRYYFNQGCEMLTDDEMSNHSEENYDLPEDVDMFLESIFPDFEAPTVEVFYNSRPWTFLGIGKHEFDDMASMYKNTYKLGSEHFVEFLKAFLSTEAKKYEHTHKN